MAKKNEIKSLMDYNTFEEVIDEGRKTLISRWVITVKEKHDGQKKPCKACLVAKSFQEGLKPQSDSPTASKDSFKLLMAVAANNNFKLASIDVEQRHLCKATNDIKKPGVIWRLQKPLYSLDDVLRKFWLRVKEVFTEMYLKIIDGDKAFYFLHEEGNLRGAVLTHVNDFNLAG